MTATRFWIGCLLAVWLTASAWVSGAWAADTADLTIHVKGVLASGGIIRLGLYNQAGKLDHIGFSSSFNREDRKKLKAIVTPLIAEGDELNSGEAGFTGKAPGGPSRWTTPDRNTEWFPLKHKLVGEFQFDHFSGGRFRHGTKFLRWRPEKKPEQCGMYQVANRQKT